MKEIQAEKAKRLGQVTSFRSRLYDIAETLVLMAIEDTKPSSERLREFRDSARDSLEQDLFSPAPIYPDLEKVKLADELARFATAWNADSPLVQQVLQGKSPEARAAELIDGSKLIDVDARRALAEQGVDVVKVSSDPLVRVAQIMEPTFRSHREETDALEERERQAYAKIAEAINTVRTTSYPDATFTLRLAFGTVKGYQENGKAIPAWTTLGGAFRHEAAHGKLGDWRLPESWVKAKDKLDMNTPFNFVSTADIIGGNSGSPVVNRKGEFVGIIFDGWIVDLLKGPPGVNLYW